MSERNGYIPEGYVWRYLKDVPKYSWVRLYFAESKQSDDEDVLKSISCQVLKIIETPKQPNNPRVAVLLPEGTPENYSQRLRSISGWTSAVFDRFLNRNFDDAIFNQDKPINSFEQILTGSWLELD